MTTENNDGPASPPEGWHAEVTATDDDLGEKLACLERIAGLRGPVTAETLTDAQIELEIRRLVDIPGIFEQSRDEPDRQLLTACFAAVEYHDRHWIRDGRYRESAGKVIAAINARREGSK